MRCVARSLVRQSGPVVLAVGVLALGLGVNTAVLAVAYGVLWRPLPYRDADRLITVALVYREDESVFGEVQRDQLDTWNRSLRTARVAGHNSRERVVRAAGRALVTEVATVAGDFFGVLGAPAMQGIVPRLANGDRRAVVSTALARMLEHEAGGPALGQTLSVGDGRYDVAAVLPSDFGFPSTDVDVWIAPPVAPSDPGSYRLVGRLQDGATLAQARDDATRVFRETLAAGADSWSADVRPIDERLRGEVRPVLQVSMGAALLVLVVACANAATLLIGRSVLRKPEFAIRIALGSGLTRLIRAALVEGLAIAGAGLILGLAAAWAGLRAFAALAAGVVPRVDAVGIDLPVLLAGLLLTVAVGVVCGSASAAGALRRDGTALRAAAPATGSRATSRLRAALVAGQIATTIVLLTGAGLLVRTVDRLLDEDAGFEPRQALTVRLMLADTPFIEGGAHNAFVETLLERVRGLPGVQAAGVGSVLPPDDEPVAIQFLYEDRRGAASRREIVLSFGAVTRGYFAALGTRLRDGRRFEAADDFADVGPVMLSETAARFVYSDEEAVGRPLPYNIDALDIARRAPIVAVTGAGLAAGLPAAAATGRSLAALLYGVSPFDPVTVATVVATVVLAALAASAIPARRAARLDPMAALRAE